MRRGSALVLSTIAGTALLVGARYATAARDDAAGIAAGRGATHGESGSGTGADPSVTPTGSAPGPSPDPSASPSQSQPPATSPPAGQSRPPGSQAAPAPTRAGGGSTPTTAPPAAPATCVTAAGNPAKVASPGVGDMTVTIKVCGGALTASTGALNQSNWSANNQAIPAMNSLTVKYYAADISRITYSGATLTAKAYQASLKSAIAKAGL